MTIVSQQWYEVKCEWRSFENQSRANICWQYPVRIRKSVGIFGTW